MSVLIAHPGVGTFVRANVESLAEHGLLDRFATTVIDDPSSAWQRIIALGGPFTRSIRALLARRRPPDVPRDRILTRPLRELVRASVSRFDRSGVWTDRAWDWMSRDFAAWAGGRIRSETRAVFGSEYNALELFEAARVRDVPRILELPSAEHDFVAQVVARERARVKLSIEEPYDSHTLALQGQRTNRRRREVDLATLVIVNSPFALDTYARAGYPTGKFVVLALGAPELPLPEQTPVVRDARILRLAWGGNFAWHKGATVLVDALQPFADRSDLRLDVYGQVQLPAGFVSRLPSWVSLHGAVPRRQFLDALGACDVLLHPSLSDGFAMVVSEAMSLGVAPIVSTATGASTLVRDRESGLLVAPGEVDSLRSAIEWCLGNRDHLPAMGAAARTSAGCWTWRDYRRAFARVVGDHLAA